MILTEQNLEYVLESVIQRLIDEEIEIDEELLDECLEEVLSESTRSKMKNINRSKKKYGNREQPPEGRGEKKFFRKMGMTDPKYHAHLEGEYDGDRKKYNNRYPKGYRRRAYDSAYDKMQ